MDLSLEIIEQQLLTAMKAKNQLAVDTLRSLKTRIQNEQISSGGDVKPDDIIALVKSEVKRRKEAKDGFLEGGREEQAAQEQQEIDILTEFLPEQVSNEELEQVIDQKISESNWTKADFGKAMGELKAHFGNTADGAVLASILKAKLG